MTVKSARLASDAEIKNRLFPKTRSWFALEAPLELLSSLSVLRILFALELIAFSAVAGGLSQPGVNADIIIGVVASSVITWAVLLRVRYVDERWTRLRFTFTTFGAVRL